MASEPFCSEEEYEDYDYRWETARMVDSARTARCGIVTLDPLMFEMVLTTQNVTRMINFIDIAVPEVLKILNFTKVIPEVVFTIPPSVFSTWKGVWTVENVIKISAAENCMANLAITIAHEFVHAKQYADGRLLWCRDMKGNAHLMFDGKPYYPKTFAQDKEAYYSAPWEMEAFTRQHSIARDIIKNLAKKVKISMADAEEWLKLVDEKENVTLAKLYPHPTEFSLGDVVKLAKMMKEAT